ncbi:TIPARP [Branchiostoma lanceolatum]|uniref:TIPARP protein n=1 Tax=Branchiostoma lanceolatum TaxID=7740 RepID=A0A8J9Z6T1_BRALA|nr:TIPARP [Branchiostoma lanceolatum]
MSGRPASSRGGRGSARGNRGGGRGRGSRGGGQGSRTHGTSAAGVPSTASPAFTTDQLVAVVKALSTSQSSLTLAQETEEQYVEEEDAGNRGQKGRQQSDQEKVSAKEGRVIRELVSILYDKPGELSIVKLQQEAKKISQRQEYQDPGNLASFLQKHDFFQTRLNKDGVMLVKVKCDVTLCGKYTASACKEDGCPHFHLCRNYASGQGCSHGLSCRDSHNLKDEHNVVVLQENFLDGLAEAQVLSMITGKSREGSKPDTSDKSTPAKSRRPPSPHQRRPIQTPPVIQPPPSHPQHPQHPPRMPPPLMGSHPGNYRARRPPSPHQHPRHPPASVGEPSHVRQQELERLPRACYFYNDSEKTCKRGPSCTSGLHVCRFFLTGSCYRKPCRLSHNIFDPQPRDLLQKSGLMGRPAQYIIDLYKENFEARRKEKQEPHRRPSTETAHDDVTIMPEHWEPMGGKEDDFVLVEIPTTGKEMNNIKAPFHQTLPSRDTKIHSIKRVQNSYLWDLYCKKKSQMKRQNNNEFPKELRLFHGTNQDAVSPICRQNFDWRLSGGNVGQLFGQGSYFTVNASFASAYSQPSYPSGRRYMFFAKVLVGRCAKGESSYRRPPPLNESDPYGKGYDSCVDDVNNPNVFVVFEPSQCYPEYIIEYS